MNIVLSIQQYHSCSKKSLALGDTYVGISLSVVTFNFKIPQYDSKNKDTKI